MTSKALRLIALLLAVLTLAGCAPQEAPAPDPVPAPAPAPTPDPVPAPEPEPTPAPAPDLSSDTTHRILTQDPTLIGRRQTVEQYMRTMGTLIWRCPEDLLYTITSNIDPQDSTGSARLELKGGRLYQGLPYAYAGSTQAAFEAYTLEKEASGVPVIGGYTWKTISGSGTSASRIGNDCSGAVAQSWAQVGASIIMTSTKYMAQDRGYLRVGDYTSSDSDNTNSAKMTTSNGQQVMYEAYARLQMGDGVVYRTSSSGHAMMAVEIRVVRKPDGTIDGQRSTVTVHEQTRSYFRALKSYYDLNLGEAVYNIYGIDIPYSFEALYNKGYLPITVKELQDPAPVAEPVVTDSRKEHDLDNLCTGLLESNWFMDCATMVITDSTGATVQQGTIQTLRSTNTELNLSRFLSELPERMHGSIQPGALAKGSYHCTLTVRIVTGQEITVRDFDFTV